MAKQGQNPKSRKGKRSGKGNPFIHRLEVVARKAGTDGVNVYIDIGGRYICFTTRLIGSPLRLQVVSAYWTQGDLVYDEDIPKAELSRRFDQAYVALGLTIPNREPITA